MKIKSGQIYVEKYIYGLDTTLQRFWFAKGRKGGVLELVFLTFYNNSAGTIDKPYVLLRHNGEIIRYYYAASVTTKTARIMPYSLYLDGGDELGVEMTGAANGDLVEVAAQWIWHADRD